MIEVNFGLKHIENWLNQTDEQALYSFANCFYSDDIAQLTEKIELWKDFIDHNLQVQNEKPNEQQETLAEKLEKEKAEFDSFKEKKKETKSFFDNLGFKSESEKPSWRPLIFCDLMLQFRKIMPVDANDFLTYDFNKFKEQEMAGYDIDTINLMKVKKNQKEMADTHYTHYKLRKTLQFEEFNKEFMLPIDQDSFRIVAKYFKFDYCQLTLYDNDEPKKQYWATMNVDDYYSHFSVQIEKKVYKAGAHEICHQCLRADFSQFPYQPLCQKCLNQIQPDCLDADRWTILHIGEFEKYLVDLQDVSKVKSTQIVEQPPIIERFNLLSYLQAEQDDLESVVDPNSLERQFIDFAFGVGEEDGAQIVQVTRFISTDLLRKFLEVLERKKKSDEHKQLNEWIRPLFFAPKNKEQVSEKIIETGFDADCKQQGDFGYGQYFFHTGSQAVSYAEVDVDCLLFGFALTGNTKALPSEEMEPLEKAPKIDENNPESDLYESVMPDNDLEPIVIFEDDYYFPIYKIKFEQ